VIEVKFRATMRMHIDDYSEDDESHWHEYNSSFDMDDVATDYAEHYYKEHDGWELDDDWGDEYYAVVVEDEDGNRKVFNISVSAMPVFSASELEK